MWARCPVNRWRVALFYCVTGEVCALREQEQLQGLSDVAEIVQHVLHVLLVVLPTTVNEDEAGHLHGPAWEIHAKY